MSSPTIEIEIKKKSKATTTTKVSTPTPSPPPAAAAATTTKEKKHKSHHKSSKTKSTSSSQQQQQQQQQQPINHSSSSSSSSEEDDTLLACIGTPRGYMSPRFQQPRHGHDGASSRSTCTPTNSTHSSSSDSDSDSDDDDDAWSINSGNTKRSTGSSSIASIHSYRSAWSSLSGRGSPRASPRMGVRHPNQGVMMSPLMTVAQYDADGNDSTGGGGNGGGARRDWRKVPSKILGDDEVEKKPILVDFDASVYDVRKMKESEREALEKGKTYALKVNKTVKKFVTLVAKKENIGNPELFELFDPANNVILNDDMPLYMYYTKEGLASKHRRRFILRVATEDGLVASSSSSSSSSSYYSDSDEEYYDDDDDDDDDDDGNGSRKRHKHSKHHHHHHKHSKHHHKHSKHHSSKKDSDKKGKKGKSRGASNTTAAAMLRRESNGEEMPLVRDRRSSAPTSQRPIIQPISTPPVNVSITGPNASAIYATPRKAGAAAQMQASKLHHGTAASTSPGAPHSASPGAVPAISVTPASPANSSVPGGKSKGKVVTEEDKARKALVPAKLLETTMPSLVWDEVFEVGRKIHPPAITTPAAAAASSDIDPSDSTNNNNSVNSIKNANNNNDSINDNSVLTTIRELLVSLPPRFKTPLATPVPAIVVRNTARASPCGRRVIVWCHGGAETLESCYPDIQRAATRVPKLDVLAPEYRGFGLRRARAAGGALSSYHRSAPQEDDPTVPQLLDDLACALRHASVAWSRPYVLYGKGLGAELALYFATKMFFVGGGSKSGAGKSALDGEAEKARRALAVLVMEDPVLSPEFCNAVELYGDCVECNVLIAVNAKEYSKNVLKRVVGEFKHVTLHHKTGASQADADAVIDEALALATKAEVNSSSSIIGTQPMVVAADTAAAAAAAAAKVGEPGAVSLGTLAAVASAAAAAAAAGGAGTSAGGAAPGTELRDGADRQEFIESINKLSQIFGSGQQKGKDKEKEKDVSARRPQAQEESSASMLREWFRRRGYDAWLAETILRAGPRSLREIAEAHPSQAQLAEFPFLERVVKEARLSVAKSQVPWKLAKKSLSGSVTKVKSPKNRMKRVVINEPPKSWNILVVIKQTK